MFIVQREIGRDSSFCVAWALTEEQLFEFFHEDKHEAIRQGLVWGESMFDIETTSERFRISRPTLPVYMHESFKK